MNLNSSLLLIIIMVKNHYLPMKKTIRLVLNRNIVVAVSNYCQQDNSFDMMCLRKHINRLDTDNRVLPR